jgi:hypothetical protein
MSLSVGPISPAEHLDFVPLIICLGASAFRLNGDER